MEELTPQPFYTPVSEPQKQRSNSPRQAIPERASQPLNPSPDSPFAPGNPGSEQPSQPSIFPQPFSRSTPGTGLWGNAPGAGERSPMGSAPVGSAPAPTGNKPSQTPHFSGNAFQDPLIVQFTTLYNASLSSTKVGNHDQARAQYSEMLKIYNQITGRPDMHDMNKDIAHFCLQDVYDNLSKTNDPTVAGLTFGALLGVTVVLLVIGGLVATNPSVVGLATGLSIFGPAAPIWIGGEPHVIITAPTTLRLSDLFTTTEKVPLTYLATSSSGIDAIVSGDYVTLAPKFGISGTTRITLMASRQDAPSVIGKQAVDVTVAEK